MFMVSFLKPVMEGKAVLFKQFGQVDSTDLEVDEADPERFVEIVASRSPSFGGINLEDSKAPDCFTIEQALSSRLDIPVFHDDQHGTGIVVAAALKNCAFRCSYCSAPKRKTFMFPTAKVS
ncbi:hypothetical protein [Bradyrhizobium niftali]|uniref:hypothetical protein n=1 Tax=Bradyrhizobium niftali TaxID=2560055 RepID=UPI001F16BB42|nr:hypothetical protein [Bradyrhizobium niftali]